MGGNDFRNDTLELTSAEPFRADLGRKWNLLMHAGRGIILLAVIVAVVYWYVSNEHTIYVSDYAGYQNITHFIVTQYRHSPWSALRAIAQSMTGEYNAIFTIPLVPWVLAAGDSRVSYEIALGVIYLLPFSLMLGALAVELIRARPLVVFWFTVSLALLTPAVWVPTLRGYPDTGGAVVLALAIWIYLRDTRLKHSWQILVIGFLVTGSVLFRRHFAYAALAFFAAVSLQALMRFTMKVRSEPKAAWEQLRTSIVRIGLTGLTASLAMIVFGHPFLMRFLTTDYNALYAGYTKLPLSSLAWYAATYGLPVVAAAIVGFLLGIRSRVVNIDAAIFLVLFGSLTLLAWLLLARQTGEQYTLNFTPVVVLGLTTLVWTIIQGLKSTARPIALTGGAAYLCANLVLGLAPVPMPAQPLVASLFAMQEAPFTRGDQAQVMELVNYLRDVAGNGEPIYVAASSSIMDKDTLISAERMLYGWDSTRLNVLYSPEIDSRDSYPSELLMRAQYVVVVDPFQYHLSPEEQRVVQVVYDLFKSNREFAWDFVELPEHFTLDEGAVVSVYRRVRPTSIPTAIRTLAFIQSYVQARPGRQPDWIILDQFAITAITMNADHTYLVTTQLAARGGMTSSNLLYIGVIPDRGVLRGDITFLDQGCSGVIVRVVPVNAAGTSESLREMGRRPENPPDFALAFEKTGPGFLLLTVTDLRTQGMTEICRLSINHLSVGPQ